MNTILHSMESYLFLLPELTEYIRHKLLLGGRKINGYQPADRQTDRPTEGLTKGQKDGQTLL